MRIVSASKPASRSKAGVAETSAWARRRCTSLMKLMIAVGRTLAAVARIGPVARPSGVRTQRATESLAAARRWARGPPGRNIFRRDQIGLDLADLPRPAFIAGEDQVDHRHASAERFRLYEMHAVDDQSASRGASAPRRPRPAAAGWSRNRGDVFRADLRIGVGRPVVQSAVDDHDRDVGIAPDRLKGRYRRGPDRADPDFSAHLLAVPHHHARRREAGDPDAHALALDDAIGGNRRVSPGRAKMLALT